jgi:hypothetical protein
VAYQDEAASIEFGGRRILLAKKLKRDLDIIPSWLKRGTLHYRQERGLWKIDAC